MHKASNLFKIISYADDSTLHKRLEINNLDQSVKNINDELAKVNNWLKLNKLSLNIDKSVFMIFHSPKKKITIPKIKIPKYNFVINHWMYYDCLREILPGKCARCLVVTHMFQAMSSWEAVREGSSAAGLKYIL